MSRTRYQFTETDYPYFITNTIVAWLPIFAYSTFADIVLDSWRFLQRERGVKLIAWVIMENHLHWIAAADNLPQHVGRFKSFTARRIIDELGARGFKTILEELRFFKLRHKIDQEYQLWQEGSHPQRIDTDEMMIQKVEYLHGNPVRRGYIDDAVHWRYSSARSYAGREGLIEVFRDWQ